MSVTTRFVAATALLAAAGASSLASTSASAQVATPATTRISATSASWPDLRVDANRDGVVDITGASDSGKRQATLTAGAVFLANVDDDAGRCPKPSGTRVPEAKLAACSDATNTIIDGNADVFDLAPLRTVPNASIPADATGRLYVRTRVGTPPTRIYLKRDGRWRLLRSFDAITAKELRAGLVAGLEGTDIVRDPRVYDGRISVTLAITSGGKTRSDTVALRQAPLLVQPTTSPMRRMLLMRPAEEPGTAQVAKDLTAVLRGTRVPLTQYPSPGLDGWTQDHFEPMIQQMPLPGGRVSTMTVLLRSPQTREGMLSVYALRGRDVGVVALPGRFKNQPTLDSMGNVEALPAGPGQQFGRVIMGTRPAVGTQKGEKPNPALVRMLTAQTGVAPLTVDTGWLDVAHIDEILHVMPVSKEASGGRGWKLAVADPAAGLALLRKAVADGHGKTPLTSDEASNFGTIASVLADKTIVENNTAAAGRLDTAIKGVMKQAGLTDADLIRVPVIYRVDINIDQEGAAAPQVPSKLVAMLPSGINGIVLGQGRYLAPKQFGPLIGGRDLFADAVTSAYKKAGVNVTYIDSSVYHPSGGEIHCGTNVVRVPTTPWWKS